MTREKLFALLSARLEDLRQTWLAVQPEVRIIAIAILVLLALHALVKLICRPVVFHKLGLPAWKAVLPYYGTKTLCQALPHRWLSKLNFLKCIFILAVCLCYQNVPTPSYIVWCVLLSMLIPKLVYHCFTALALGHHPTWGLLMAFVPLAGWPTIALLPTTATAKEKEIIYHAPLRPLR